MEARDASSLDGSPEVKDVMCVFGEHSKIGGFLLSHIRLNAVKFSQVAAVNGISSSEAKTAEGASSAEAVKTTDGESSSKIYSPVSRLANAMIDLIIQILKMDPL